MDWVGRLIFGVGYVRDCCGSSQEAVEARLSLVVVAGIERNRKISLTTYRSVNVFYDMSLFDWLHRILQFSHLQTYLQCM